MRIEKSNEDYEREDLFGSIPSLDDVQTNLREQWGPFASQYDHHWMADDVVLCRR